MGPKYMTVNVVPERSKNRSKACAGCVILAFAWLLPRGH